MRDLHEVCFLAENIFQFDRQLRLGLPQVRELTCHRLCQVAKFVIMPIAENAYPAVGTIHQFL